MGTRGARVGACRLPRARLALERGRPARRDDGRAPAGETPAPRHAKPGLLRAERTATSARMKSPKFFAFVCVSTLAVGFFSGCTTTKTAGTGDSFKGPIGLQLYSLRADFKKDVPGTMAKVGGYNIKYVELASTYGLEPDKFLALLDANGLKAVSSRPPNFHRDVFYSNKNFLEMTDLRRNAVSRSTKADRCPASTVSLKRGSSPRSETGLFNETEEEAWGLVWFVRCLSAGPDDSSSLESIFHVPEVATRAST